MNRLVFSILLSAFAMGTLAQSPAHAPAVAPATADPVPASEVTEISGDKDQQEAPNCLRQAGTRIVNKDKHACVNAAGRSYSQKDIRRTGATDVGDALGLLDPSIQIQH